MSPLVIGTDKQFDAISWQSLSVRTGLLANLVLRSEKQANKQERSRQKTPDRTVLLFLALLEGALSGQCGCLEGVGGCRRVGQHRTPDTGHPLLSPADIRFTSGDRNPNFRCGVTLLFIFTSKNVKNKIKFAC